MSQIRVNSPLNRKVEENLPIKIVAGSIDSDIKLDKSSIENNSIYEDRDKVVGLNLLKKLSNDLSIRLEETITDLRRRDHEVNISALFNTQKILSNQLSIQNLFQSLDKIENSYERALFPNGAIRFKGITTTDPTTGILTVNGNKYFVSSDFNSSNNGDVYYYRDVQKKVIGNQTISEGLIYAYIYCNGRFKEDLALTSEAIDRQNGFYKIGYGFYNNLSTTIFDAMVDDRAAIKMYKIDGLQNEFNGVEEKIMYLSGQHDWLSDEMSSSIDYLSSMIRALDAPYDYFASKQEVKNVSTDLSGEFRNYVLTSQITTVKKLIEVPTESRYSTNKVPSLRTLSGTLLDYSLTSHTHASANIIGLPQVITSLENRYIPRSYIDQSLTDLTSHVPATKLLKDQIAALTNMINNLSAQLTQKMKPKIGTLRYVASKNLPTISLNSTTLNSSSFDGWVYPNGGTVPCTQNTFQAAKRAFGYSATATSFVLPDLRNFFKANPGPVSDQSLKSHQSTCKSHTHQISLTTSTTERNVNVTIPSGTSSGSTGLHCGWSGDKDFNTSIKISYPALDVKGTTIGSDSKLDVEPLPKHNIIPLMIYIGNAEDV